MAYTWGFQRIASDLLAYFPESNLSCRKLSPLLLGTGLINLIFLGEHVLDMFVKSVHQVRCFPRSSLYAGEKLFFLLFWSQREKRVAVGRKAVSYFW
jgi:hypothetical protein